MTHLAAFLEGLHCDALDSLRGGSAPPARQGGFLGASSNAETADLLPAMEAEVVPSTVRSRSAWSPPKLRSCGVLPICAAHSWLAEVTERLADACRRGRAALSFSVDDGAVAAIARRVVAWLDAEPAVRDEARAALARRRGDLLWERVGEGLVAAIEGRLDGLERAD